MVALKFKNTQNAKRHLQGAILSPDLEAGDRPDLEAGEAKGRSPASR